MDYISLLLDTPTLECLEAWKEDVILKVNMLEESIHKGLEIL